jgi:E3 ubiquitin-protein ligase HUWE1
LTLISVVNIVTFFVKIFFFRYRFVGRLIGKACYDRHVLDVPLCDFLFKRILRQIPTLEDVKQLDPVYCQSLQWILDHDITGAIDETFSVLRNEFGSMVVVDLCPNGRNIEVNNENKSGYVQAVIDYQTGSAIKPQLDALLLGFGELIPRHAISSFTAQELKALVNGKDTIDAASLRAGVKYSGAFIDSDPMVQRFWIAFQTMGDKDRQDLLRFVTGTCRIPLDGFDPPFTLTPSDMDASALPMAHTCFNQLVLPTYSTVELLLKRLKTAVTHGIAEGFHLT